MPKLKRPQEQVRQPKTRRLASGRHRAFITKNGRQYSEVFDTEQEAIDWYWETHGLLHRGEVPKRRKEGITFGEVIERYMAEVERTKSEGTVKVRRSQIKNHIDPTLLYAVRAKDINPDVVALWVEDREEAGVSARTIADVKSTLGTIFRWAIRRRLIDAATDPFGVIEVRPPNRKEIEALTPGQVQTLLAAIEDPDLHDAVMALAYLGCRVSDLALLKPSHFDRVNGVIKVGNKKSQESRRRKLKVPAPLLPVLIRRFEMGEPWLFMYDHRDGGRRQWTSERFYARFVKVAQELPGMAEVTPHWLRHTCASFLISRKASVVAVAKWLGHKSANTTMKYYAHLFEGDTEEMADMLEGLIPERKLRAV